MTSPTTALAGCLPRWLPRRGVSFVALLAVACNLSGCANPTLDRGSIDDLPPLRVGDTTLVVADARRIPRAELLSLDEPMREFVARYTGGQTNSHIRLMSLHDAVRGAGGLSLEYDPFAEGDARQVFHRRTANCLSYASLFIALAREAGLEANYQWIDVRPQWSRVNQRAQVGLHVNVVVRLKDGKRYMVDIDPLPSHNITGSQMLTDSQGEALFYNNIAMAALGRDELDNAWLYLVRALQLDPSNAHLWANLGAVYRSNGQHREAEQSYLQALDLDFTERSAMTNLAVLYGLQGREEEQKHWLDRVEFFRRSNPYYHAWLGEEAASAGEWDPALAHYDRAVDLAPYDSHLVFSRGVIYYQIGEYEDAVLNIEQAIDLATLHSDRTYFQRQLDRVRREQLEDL